MSAAPTTPALSVVVVTPADFAQIRRTVRHLRDQDAADRVELVVVAPSEAAVADARPGELDGFWGVKTVGVGPIPNVDRASANGVFAASADIVGIVEDHAFVGTGWAGAIIDAYARTGADVVGSVMRNANPARMLSWVNLYLAYDQWVDPAGAGDVDDCAGHNVTYRRAALAPFGEALPDHLGRAGHLHDRLRAAGRRFHLASGAEIAHVNPSRLSATADLRFHAGRLYGALRARDGGWSAARRVLYILGGPLIPAVRLARVRAEFAHLWRASGLLPRLYPALAAGLVLDAAGQVAGYARGAGTSLDRLSVFEMDRLRHLTAADRAGMRE